MVYYTIEYKKNEGKWLIWKNIERNNAFNFMCVFEGTLKECKEKLKELCKAKKSL